MSGAGRAQTTFRRISRIPVLSDENRLLTVLCYPGSGARDPVGVKRGSGADPTRKRLVISVDVALTLTLRFTSTAIRAPGLCRSRDPSHHPGASRPGRDHRPVPGTGCDGPTWAATAPGQRESSSRIRRRSSGPALPVLYRQILALFISCRLHAHNSYSYIHKYMNAPFTADAGLRAGIIPVHVRLLLRLPMPGACAAGLRMRWDPLFSIPGVF